MKTDLNSLKEWGRQTFAFADKYTAKIFPQRPVDTITTACDLGRSKAVLLELQKKEDHLFIHHFEIIRNAFQDQKPSLVLKPYFDGKKFRKEGIRVALKGHGVVIRFVRFPKMKVEDLGGVLKYEAEQYIPFELNDVGMDFGVVEESLKTDEGEKMEIMLAAVKRQQLEPVLEVFRNLECHLDAVDVDILAIMAALEYFHPEDFSGHVGILDLGTEISTLGMVREGKPRFIRDVSYGSYDLQKRLKTRSNLSDDKIEQFFDRNMEPSAEEEKAIRESLEGLIGDLRVSFDYYHDQVANSKPVEKLYLSGGGAHPLILKCLSEGLHMPVLSMDIMKKVKCGPEVNAEQFAAAASILPVALGLGIRDV